MRKLIPNLRKFNIDLKSFSTIPLLDGSPKDLPLEPSSLPLSPSQEHLLKLLQSGRNVYFTGKAGSGKTRVLQQFIKHLRSSKIKVGVTAPTGVAAALINGQTLHSFSSIPIDLSGFTIDQFVNHIKSKKSILRRYRETSCLILDEVSMISPDFFDIFNTVCKKVRDDNRPFGGLQVVLSGDFFQLPPVNMSAPKPVLSKEVVKRPSAYLSYLKGPLFNPENDVGSLKFFVETGTRYLFHSKAWLDLILHDMQLVQLDTAFRQSDPAFVSVLDDLRFGTFTNELWSFLEQYKNRHLEWPSSGIKPTFLSGYRAATEKYNMRKLLELPGFEQVYDAVDSVKLNDNLNWRDTDTPMVVDPIFNLFTGQSQLQLKVGAQVILLRNLDVKNNLANGSRGVVEGFVNRHDKLLERNIMLPVVRFLSGNQYVIGYHDFETCLDSEGITIQRRQLPLKLGWGMTIHRAQGMTLDRAIIDLPEAFVPGHAYVALSRIKTLDGLSLARFSEKSLYVSLKVQEFHSRFMS